MNSTTLDHTLEAPTPLLVRSSAVLAAGGLSWVAKIAVIAATDGATSGSPDTITSVLYLLGVALSAAGLAGIAVALTKGRHLALRIVSGVAGFISFFFIYVILEGIAQSIVGDAGPSWFHDEVGILTTGAVLAAAGMFVIRRTQRM